MRTPRAAVAGDRVRAAGPAARRAELAAPRAVLAVQWEEPAAAWAALPAPPREAPRAPRQVPPVRAAPPEEWVSRARARWRPAMRSRTSQFRLENSEAATSTAARRCSAPA